MSVDPGFTLRDARLRLLVPTNDLPSAAREVGKLLAATGTFFDRGGPVAIVTDTQTGALAARLLTRESVVNAVHDLAQPFEVRTIRGKDQEREITLPDRVALLYLDRAGAYGLPPLRGFAYAPLLTPGGAITAHDGYDARTGLWCTNLPKLARLVPRKPTRRQAEAALRVLRQRFATFPFADSPRCRTADGLDVVDLSYPPGMDESSLLAGVLTAVCRASLPLAPALLVRAPTINGSGAGKGLLVRAICAIAFGLPPVAFTGGADRKELELRLGAAMMEAAPCVFIDNMNTMTLKSSLLASVLTELPTQVRVLGISHQVRLNPTCFVAVTGNGLSLSEDLVRRFLTVDLDTRTEDAETRSFPGDLLDEVMRGRALLLAAALTVWRWGQMHPRDLTRGATLGSYGQWARDVRDPLLSLGCADPVARVAEAKAADQQRQDIALMFQTWAEHHGAKPVRLSGLHAEVVKLIDPQARGRQFVEKVVSSLVSTRIAGLTLTRCKTAAQWSVATFALMPVLPME